MKKKLLTALVALLLLLCAWGIASGETFTLMMYMCGSDLQEDCVTDMKEMLKAKTGSDIRIVVLAGGAKSWPDSRLKAKRLNLFTISGGSYSSTTDWGNASMGDPSTLKRFVEYCLTNYPADRTMLVMWNHGNGSAEGVCFDDVHSDDSLTLTEINTALSGALKGKKLDIVGFDACLMGTYEAAAMLQSYASYMIGSEELEPYLGWYYTDWLKALSSNPGMSTPELCKTIVSTYKKACEKDNPRDYYTLSALDLQKMPALITEMEQLSAYLADALNNKQLSTISRMRQRIKSYGYWDQASTDMIDITSFLDICQQFAPERTAAARSAAEAVVLENYKSSMVSVASGIAIYMPMDTRTSVSSYMKGYAISDIPQYVDFVKGYAAMLNGGSYVFSASAPTSVSYDDMTGSSFSDALDVYAFIPGATYSGEVCTTGTCDTGSQSGLSGLDFIGGSAGSVSGQTGSSSGSDFIGGTGSASGQTGGITPVSGSAGQTGDTVSGLSFIGGTAGVTLQTPQVTESSFAFSLSLSTADMENLSRAEGVLMMDMSQQDMVVRVELGISQATWIDWRNGKVYSLFDGTWPTFGGQMVTMYDLSRTEAAARSIIPVKVNGTQTYLVVQFPGSGTTGTVLGYNGGYDTNGLPIRATTPLQVGDVIVPVYTMYYGSKGDEAAGSLKVETVDGDPITWDGTQQVVYSPLKTEKPANYAFAFYLVDIFGERELTDPDPFTL